MEYPVFDEASALDPHPLLDRMRHASPFWRCDLLNGWLLTRYDDCAALFRDERMRMNANTDVIAGLPQEQQEALQPMVEILQLWMGQLPREGHLRVQKVFRQYFTQKRIDALRPRVREFTQQYLKANRHQGEIELVNGLSYPLPVAVIGEMLGVPEADFPKILEWSKDLESIFIPFGPVEKLFSAQANVLAMQDYCRELLHRKMQQPADDVLTVLADAIRAGEVTEDEVLANCVVLLFAGHETTAGLIAYGLKVLLEHPEQWQLLHEQPGLMPGAVDEMMRYCGPTHMVARVPREVFAMGDVVLKTGEPVFLMVNAANRDPAVFPDPHRFDIRRESRSKHLGFGLGSYYCLGAALAQMEVAEVLGVLLGYRVEVSSPAVMAAVLPMGNKVASFHLRIT